LQQASRIKSFFHLGLGKEAPLSEEEIAVLEPKEEQEAFDQEALQHGLAEQRVRGRKELLGEDLLSLT
jgi:hypothetical protein